MDEGISLVARGDQCMIRRAPQQRRISDICIYDIPI